MRSLLLVLNALTFLAAGGFVVAIAYDVAMHRDPLDYVSRSGPLMAIFVTFAALPLLSSGFTLAHLWRRR